MSDLVTRLLAEIDRREAKARDMPDIELEDYSYRVGADGEPIWQPPPKVEALRMCQAHRKILAECSRAHHGSAADLAYELLHALAAGYGINLEEDPTP